MVAYFHAQPMVDAAYGAHAPVYMGSFGVDLFFVVSGFIMYYNLSQNEFSFKNFLLNRFFRIVPLYWISTLFISFIFLLGFRPAGLHNLDFIILIKSILFIKTWFPDGRLDLFLSVGWTLIYEIFFYVTFYLTAPLQSARKSLAILFCLFTVLVATGPYLQLGRSQIDDFFNPILFEFLFGGMIAVCITAFRQRFLNLGTTGKALILVIFVLTIGYLLAVEILVGEVPDNQRVLTLGIPAALIVGCGVAGELAGWRITNKALLMIGGASYSLYLFHPVIIQASVKFLAKSSFVFDLGFIFATGLSLMVAVAVSIVIHRHVEMPFIRLGKRLSRRPESPSLRVAIS